MLQTLNFIAGGRQANAKADFFRYESCSANGADESIRVRADGNDLGLFLPGDFVNLPVFATRWEVMPVTAAAAGTFRLGVGQVGSSRLTGTVRVVDQGYERTLAGRQFIATISASASAGQNAYAGIYNNGANFSVKRAVVQSSIAGPAWIAKAGGTGTALVAPTSDVANKLASGAVATVRRASGYGAGTIPTVGEVPGYLEFGRLYVPANLPVEYPLTTPLLFTSNASILVNAGMLNRDISIVLDMEEL